MQSNVTVQGVTFVGAQRAVLVNNGTVGFLGCGFVGNGNGMSELSVVISVF